MSTPVAIYRQEGESIDYTPVADVAAGDVIDLGNFVGIATHPIAANIMGALAIEGVFDINKFTAEVWAVGDIIYWDQGTLTATKTVGYSEAKIGFAVRVALTGDATGRVKLWPGID